MPRPSRRVPASAHGSRRARSGSDTCVSGLRWSIVTTSTTTSGCHTLGTPSDQRPRRDDAEHDRGRGAGPARRASARSQVAADERSRAPPTSSGDPGMRRYRPDQLAGQTSSLQVRGPSASSGEQGPRRTVRVQLVGDADRRRTAPRSPPTRRELPPLAASGSTAGPRSVPSAGRVFAGSIQPRRRCGRGRLT